MQATCHPVLNGAGDVVEVFGTARDVTERKQAEHALREAQAALAHVTRVTTLGEVTASIAHEVNQPLAAIANNANACRGLLASGAPGRRTSCGEVLADIVGRRRAGERHHRARAGPGEALGARADGAAARSTS